MKNTSHSDNMDIAKIEEQLNDLLNMLGCPEKSGSVANRSSEEEKIFCPSVMSPLDRIVKTKPIWFCQDVSRDEVIQMLHNKKTGNFIIRGCTQPHTLALSVKLTDREGFPPVQHFIIVQRGRKVHLEDSDLMFDNIVSLTFHYTQVCDELPERLTLPDVLSTATSVQNLVSLSLLGKSFWSYPMAKSERSSVFIQDNNINNINNNSSEFDEKIEEHEREPLTRTPPRPPNRSRSTSQPQPQAPSRHKSRRNSDSVPFIISPARVPRPARHSLADLYSRDQHWVSSPVFNAGRDSPPLSNTRTRKVSVFYNKLGHVEEEDVANNSENITNQVDKEEDDHHEDDEEADYAYPLDAIKEENDNCIYENPHSAVNEAINKSGDNDDRISDGDDKSQQHLDYFFGDSETHNHHQDKRKLSLGVIFRKLSSGSLPVKERKTSLQERRLSTALSKLITLPIFERRTVNESSYQVNSLSWEFLNKDEDDECEDGDGDKKERSETKQHHISEQLQKIVEKHPSTDSLYESEFDSSSTMESTTSTSSRQQQQQQHQLQQQQRVI